MQKSATSNHFCRKCLEDSWNVLKKSTPSSGGWASSSRKHAPVRAPLLRAWSAASRMTPPPPPVRTPRFGPMNVDSCSIKADERGQLLHQGRYAVRVGLVQADGGAIEGEDGRLLELPAHLVADAEAVLLD